MMLLGFGGGAFVGYRLKREGPRAARRLIAGLKRSLRKPAERYVELISDPSLISPNLVADDPFGSI